MEAKSNLNLNLNQIQRDQINRQTLLAKEWSRIQDLWPNYKYNMKFDAEKWMWWMGKQ